MPRKAFRLIGLVLALFLPVSCAGRPEPSAEPPAMEERQAEFQVFLSEVNTRHRAACGTPWAIPFRENWTPDLSGLTGRLTKEEMLSMVLRPSNPPEALSIQQAAEDIEAAFLLLKHAYAAYDYFGGDEAFLPIRDAALADLPEVGEVSTETLKEILIARLTPAVVDGHFKVGSTILSKNYTSYTYYVPDLFFDSPDGLPAELVKPTVDGEGRIRFCLAVITTPEAAELLPASLEMAGEPMVLNWVQDEPIEWDGTDIFTETVLPDGVPPLTCNRTASRTDEQAEQLERLVSCGEEYADTPLLIWDFRGNSGGSGTPFYNWFQGYTGQPPAARSTMAAKYSEFNTFAATHREKEPSYLPGMVCWAWRHDAGRWLENDGLLLVLQDKGSASAAELALIDLYTLENTLCIGSSTYGALLTAYNDFSTFPTPG